MNSHSERRRMYAGSRPLRPSSCAQLIQPLSISTTWSRRLSLYLQPYMRANQPLRRTLAKQRVLSGASSEAAASIRRVTINPMSFDRGRRGSEP